MIKIILMRHGEPVLAQTGRITPTEMERWIKLYNFAEVKADSAPIASLQWANSTTSYRRKHCTSSAVICSGAGPYSVRCRRRVLRGSTSRLLYGGFLGYRLSFGLYSSDCFGFLATHEVPSQFRSRKSAPRPLPGNLFLLLSKTLFCL